MLNVLNKKKVDIMIYFNPGRNGCSGLMRVFFVELLESFEHVETRAVTDDAAGHKCVNLLQ